MIRIKQIYWDDEQLKGLEYEPENNLPVIGITERYLFLESAVIARLVAEGEHKGTTFFGVLSPNFRQKIEGTRGWGKDIKNTGDVFTKLRFENFVKANQQADIISLCRHRPHSVFKFAEQYHPGMIHFAKTVFNKAGISYDFQTISQVPVYFNYFVAKPDIMQKFVIEMLLPCFQAIEHDEECRHLAFMNSNYPKAFPDHLQKAFGITYWPFHPFFTERLISVFITKHNLKAKQF